MRGVIPIAAGIVLLATSSPALAGGSSVTPINHPPRDLAAGETWTAQLRVVRCVIGPEAAGMRPWVEISNAKTGERIRVPARPTRIESREARIYEAEVAFPSPGEWRYSMGERSYKYGWFRVEIAARERSALQPIAVGRRTSRQAAAAELSTGAAAVALLAAAALSARNRRRKGAEASFRQLAARGTRDPLNRR